MESLLDAQLCERLSRGVRLTPLGQSLARHARSVLLQLLQAEQEIIDMRTGRSGSVALGAVTAPAIDLAAPAISKIRSIFPRIELNIKIDTSNAAGARASRLAARFHHRPRARRSRSRAVRLPDDRRRGGVSDRARRPSAAGPWPGPAQPAQRLRLGDAAARHAAAAHGREYVPGQEPVAARTPLQHVLAAADDDPGRQIRRDRADVGRGREILRDAARRRRRDRNPADQFRDRRPALQPDQGAQSRHVAGRAIGLRFRPHRSDRAAAR